MRILVFFMLALIASPAYSQITIGRYRVNGSIEFNADLQIEEVVPMTTIPDPVAFWKASDLTSEYGSFDLTNNNGVTFGAGKIGNAFYLSGSNQSLSIPGGSVGDLSVGAGGLTIQSWFYLSGLPTNTTWLIAGIEGEYNLYVVDTFFTNPRLRAGANVTSTQITAEWTTDLSTGTWYHAVGRVDEDADELTLWVNGTKVVTTPFVGSVRQINNLFSIGKGSLGGYYNGRIDMPAVWDTALSDAQITALYNDGDGVELPLPIDPVPEANLHSAVPGACERRTEVQRSCETRTAVSQSNVLRKTVTVPHPQ